MKEEGPKYYNAIRSDLTQNPHWRRMYNAAMGFIPLSYSVVDLGCGSGDFARILYEAGHRSYWGIDFAKIRIAAARKAVPKFKFTVGSLYDEKVQREFVKYDAFVVLEVLEHLSRDIAVLEAIPAGRLVVLSVPNAGGIGHVRRFKKAKEVIRRYRGIIAFDEVVKILRKPPACFFLGHGVRI